MNKPRFVDIASTINDYFSYFQFILNNPRKGATPEERYAARLAESKPILDAFSAWLKTQQARVLPKGLLGKAITYSLNQWEKLNVFLQDVRPEIDNNRTLDQTGCDWKKKLPI